MTNWRKTWVPPRNPKVPDTVKCLVEAKAKDLIALVLKPKCVQPPPKDPKFNYIVDLSTKWHGGCFYFVAKYACHGPNTISPFFDVGFARLRYLSNDLYNLAYHRHTGEWLEIHPRLSLDECMTTIRDEQIFHP